jgi:hypothetical protein
MIEQTDDNLPSAPTDPTPANSGISPEIASALGQYQALTAQTEAGLPLQTFEAHSPQQAALLAGVAARTGVDPRDIFNAHAAVKLHQQAAELASHSLEAATHINALQRQTRSDLDTQAILNHINNEGLEATDDNSIKKIAQWRAKYSARAAHNQAQIEGGEFNYVPGSPEHDAYMNTPGNALQKHAAANAVGRARLEISKLAAQGADTTPVTNPDGSTNWSATWDRAAQSMGAQRQAVQTEKEQNMQFQHANAFIKEYESDARNKSNPAMTAVYNQMQTLRNNLLKGGKGTAAPESAASFVP